MNLAQSFYSAWPIVIILVAIIALSSTSLLSAADVPPGITKNRLSTIDGLRGLLALAVLVHHGAIYHDFLSTGMWHGPPPPYAALGSGGVGMFFLITGFLFWARLIDQSGRPKWMRLYIGRLFRIGPVYLLAVSLMLVVVFGSTRQLNVPVPMLLGQILLWLPLGTGYMEDINKYPGTWLLLAATPWSLWYEWAFYASLPALALPIRFGAHFPVAILAFFGALVMCIVSAAPEGPSVWPFVTLFSGGMLVASLIKQGFGSRLPNAIASVAVSAVLCGIVVFVEAVYSAFPIVLLTASFYLIASGCSVFGLLTTRAAKRLGDVSYGIYLLQGLALAAVLRPLENFALQSPAAHWTLVGLSAVLTVAAATIAHVTIELPGVDLGKRVADILTAHLFRQIKVQ